MITKTDFDLVIVEGSKLGTKSDYNCREKKLNTLLENNIILAAETYFNFESDFDTQTKVKNNFSQT